MLPVLVVVEGAEAGDLPAPPCMAPTSPTPTSAHLRGPPSSSPVTGMLCTTSYLGLTSSYVVTSLLVQRFYTIVDGNLNNKNCPLCGEQRKQRNDLYLIIFSLTPTPAKKHLHGLRSQRYLLRNRTVCRVQREYLLSDAELSLPRHRK